MELYCMVMLQILPQAIKYSTVLYRIFIVEVYTYSTIAGDHCLITISQGQTQQLLVLFMVLTWVLLQEIL